MQLEFRFRIQRSKNSVKKFISNRPYSFKHTNLIFLFKLLFSLILGGKQN